MGLSIHASNPELHSMQKKEEKKIKPHSLLFISKFYIVQSHKESDKFNSLKIENIHLKYMQEQYIFFLIFNLLLNENNHAPASYNFGIRHWL
jgi:hypothetical protein